MSIPAAGPQYPDFLGTRVGVEPSPDQLPEEAGLLAPRPWTLPNGFTNC
jgi:hypothetical protein